VLAVLYSHGVSPFNPANRPIREIAAADAAGMSTHRFRGIARTLVREGLVEMIAPDEVKHFEEPGYSDRVFYRLTDLGFQTVESSGLIR